jgi:hypothetical protein
VFHVSVRRFFGTIFILIKMCKEAHVGRKAEFPLLLSEFNEVCDVWKDVSKSSQYPQYQIQRKSVKRFSNSCMQQLFFLTFIMSGRNLKIVIT